MFELLLYSTLFNANVMQNRLFTLSTRDAKFCFLCLHRLISIAQHCAKIVALSNIHNALRHARQWCHQSMDTSVTHC